MANAHFIGGVHVSSREAVMAGKPQYAEADKARAFICLQANQGNIKRTARDTGIPVSTIRHWKTQWEAEPDSSPDVALVTEATNDFLSEAERVRDTALRELERKIPSATPSALVATVGMLTDKIALVRGLATTRVEHKHVLPAPEELKELVDGFVRGAVEAAQRRELEADIIDGEVLAIEPPDKD